MCVALGGDGGLDHTAAQKLRGCCGATEPGSTATTTGSPGSRSEAQQKYWHTQLLTDSSISLLSPTEAENASFVYQVRTSCSFSLSYSRPDPVLPLIQKREAQISVSKVHFRPVTRPVRHNAPLCRSAAVILGMCCWTFVAFPPSCAPIIVVAERRSDGRVIRASPASGPELFRPWFRPSAPPVATNIFNEIIHTNEVKTTGFKHMGK